MLCLSVQNCHELEKMDLEECILVRYIYIKHCFYGIILDLGYERTSLIFLVDR